MLMESQERFFWTPQNISGASQQNSVAGFSLTTEEDGDLFWILNQMAPEEFQVSGSPETQNVPETT